MFLKNGVLNIVRTRVTNRVKRSELCEIQQDEGGEGWRTWNFATVRVA
jgi:hypothetical protein